ncbi:pyridoxal 5'-phosphate synthase glutaminase subunit PdxT [Thermomicrobiaceae bacterium CFH 74404]|uniref:Pyridoxal 5'-phosphate synthase subunit PdxT n=1 Tax=Thermalbibacter longus TaxID=2951981 RepID=A0AA41W9I6_9BACT|nr:pyridoxal 5'-phosphate synthase glutaminase subunit PdxT [Thermalbibacter longus]MCM8747702.1 pyridoxal 5'-phosphate synthase glutaminase subunit PdxT [Thermalbibacter longus]
MQPVIGVLALQGDFREHLAALARLGVEGREIRLPSELAGISGLIIPGGESTTIGRLIERFGLREPIVEFARSGRPIWGTCAGMIVLAREVDPETRARTQHLLGLLDIVVRRNAFGPQIESFETDLEIPAVGSEPVRAVFIRAPVVAEMGPAVEPLARLTDGTVAAVRQGNLIGTAFHPELTGDDRFHAWFCRLAREHSPAVQLEPATRGAR